MRVGVRVRVRVRVRVTSKVSIEESPVASVSCSVHIPVLLPSTCRVYIKGCRLGKRGIGEVIKRVGAVHLPQQPHGLGSVGRAVGRAIRGLRR